MLPASTKLSVPEYVLVQELDGESVLLNLNKAQYFGLDDVGTWMWKVLTTADSIQHAIDTLLVEYEVEPAQLRKDLYNLIDHLVEHDLVQVL